MLGVNNIGLLRKAKMSGSINDKRYYHIYEKDLMMLKKYCSCQHNMVNKTNVIKPFKISLQEH